MRDRRASSATATIRHVRGDPDHPVSRGKLCRKCSIGYNGAFLDPQARLTRPLRRTGAKGEGRFEPVSWDEAIGEIAERLRGIVAASGAHTILNAHYTGTFALLAYFFPLRFFNRLGATEVDPDTICNKAGHVALDYVYGTSLVGFDPRTARDSACILVWGANPSASAPHAHEHWLPESPGASDRRRPDPDADGRGRRPASPALPRQRRRARLRPSARHLPRRARRRGLPRRRTPSAGTSSSRSSPTARRSGARRTTGVPAALIEEAAGLYARGPSLLWIGQGLQRQRTGGNVVRACALLPAVTGNLGKPGAGFLYLNGDRVSRHRRGLPRRPAPRARTRRQPISHMDLADVPGGPGSRRRRSSAGTSTSPPRTRSRRACSDALAREDLLHGRRSTSSRPTRPTSPTTFCRPRASSSSTTSSRSYFHLTLSAQVKVDGAAGRGAAEHGDLPPPRRGDGLRRARALRGDATSSTTLLAALERRRGLRRPRARKGTVPIVAGAGRPVRRPADSRRRAGRSSSPPTGPRPTAFRASPLPLADPRPAGTGGSASSRRHRRWLLNDSFAQRRRRSRSASARRGRAPPRRRRRAGPRRGRRGVRRRTRPGTLGSASRSRTSSRGRRLSHKGRWPKREPGGANVNVLNPGERPTWARAPPSTASR